MKPSILIVVVVLTASAAFADDSVWQTNRPEDQSAGDSWTQSLASAPSAPTENFARRPIVLVSGLRDAAGVELPVPTPEAAAPRLLPETPRQDVPGLLERQYQERDSNYQMLLNRLQQIVNRDSEAVASAEDPQQTASVEDPRQHAGQSNPVQGQQSLPPAIERPNDTSHDVTSPQRPVATATPPFPTQPMPALSQLSPETHSSQNLQTAPQNPLPMPAAKPSSVFADSMTAQALIDGPVDRIGLADNLYAVDELQIALEMYEQVNVRDVPESERYWVMYQSASCLRRLGRAGDAQERYRRLAGQSSAGWLAKTSRWWLDQMDSRTALEAEISKQNNIVAGLSEVINESNAQPRSAARAGTAH